MEEEPIAGGMPSGMPSGSNRASDRQEYYTASEAAKIFDISERRVRQIAQDGKIEGVRTEDGWKLFRYSVHDFRDHRAVQPPTRGAAREEPSEVREWIERVAALERELGRLEGRLELTERAESTMREERERLLEDLARERERAAQKQESAEEAREEAELFVKEREEAQKEARRLREELEAERSKGFWQRLFGG